MSFGPFTTNNLGSSFSCLSKPDPSTSLRAGSGHPFSCPLVQAEKPLVKLR
jgi:hypothetical protein